MSQADGMGDSDPAIRLSEDDIESSIPCGLDGMRLGDLANKPEHVIDLAVRNLVLTIEPGEKVAICGRTGRYVER